MRGCLIALVLLVLLAPASEAGVLPMADGAAAEAARYRNFDCTFRGGPDHRWWTGSEWWHGSSYFLTGFGTTCRFAKRWVRRLAKEPYSGGKVPRRRNPPLEHGPPGWRCESQFIAPVLKPQTAYKGVCQNKADLRREFSWEPQSGPDDGPVDPNG